MVTSPSIYNKICSRIIREQEFAVGSLSWELAAKVAGLSIVNKQFYEVSISELPKAVINDLVLRFEKVFGSFAAAVSRQAVADILADMPIEDVPEELKK